MKIHTKNVRWASFLYKCPWIHVLELRLFGRIHTGDFRQTLNGRYKIIMFHSAMISSSIHFLSLGVHCANVQSRPWSPYRRFHVRAAQKAGPLVRILGQTAAAHAPAAHTQAECGSESGRDRLVFSTVLGACGRCLVSTRGGGGKHHSAAVQLCRSVPGNNRASKRRRSWREHSASLGRLCPEHGAVSAEEGSCR